ncbi:PREDICTED: uncharacterized protein At4g02000-like [Camelina sativa]|uniref:Uncharacterized protein At4g02000-like n=1 Tax=Camelina sativa TaxID=90675 RepID=A0ABM0WAL1_CAMSA|nr:PREDICTED: uncharacterized protein At4g02000-like [Camelina sativa]
MDDEIKRSDLNSQSHVSDDSLPAPFSQPPRLESPPLNPEEIAAASPYFPHPGIERFQQFAVPIPQSALGKQKSSTGSTSALKPEKEIYSKTPRCFEVGESSKRKSSRPDPKVSYGNQRHKSMGAELGEFHKPPKKRLWWNTYSTAD